MGEAPAEVERARQMTPMSGKRQPPQQLAVYVYPNSHRVTFAASNNRRTAIVVSFIPGGTIMADEEKKRLANDAGRRLFLQKAGRFAAVTPPAVALMLSATGKAPTHPWPGPSQLVPYRHQKRYSPY